MIISYISLYNLYKLIQSIQFEMKILETNLGGVGGTLSAERDYVK